MFKLFNKDGVELPLSMPTEEDAKSLIGVPPKNIKEVVKDYGEGFQGDLIVASYKAYGDKDTQKVLGNFGEAAREIRDRQQKAQITLKHKESEYLIGQQNIDKFSVNLIMVSVFLFVAVAGCYGLYRVLSLFLPVILTSVLTGIVSVPIVLISALHIVNLIKYKNKPEESIETMTSLPRLRAEKALHKQIKAPKGHTGD